MRPWQIGYVPRKSRSLSLPTWHFLPKAVREAPRHGMLNFHASILPAYRGLAVEAAMPCEGDGCLFVQVVKKWTQERLQTVSA